MSPASHNQVDTIATVVPLATLCTRCGSGAINNFTILTCWCSTSKILLLCSYKILWFSSKM